MKNNIKITFLGTGHASATNCYNACFTLENQNDYFLVDSGGGNGILKQLKKANISISKIRWIFISHIHMDHLLGVLWIIRVSLPKYYKKIYEQPLYIMGNDEVIKVLRMICAELMPKDFLPLLDNKIIFITINEQRKYKILENEVYFFDINAKKVKQLGFNMYINLKSNTYKFTFIGDEPCYKNTEKFVNNSTWLIADAYSGGKAAKLNNPIKEHHHSTVEYTANISQKLNVKTLFLTHTLDNNLKNRKRLFTKYAKKIYNGNVIIPKDLETFCLNDLTTINNNSTLKIINKGE